MLTVRHFFALTGIRIKNWSVYRFDFFASIMGMIFPIIGLSLYWLDTLKYNTEVEGFVFTSKTIIVYYIIVFAIDMLFSYELAFSVEEDIATGKMNAYLILPCNYITVKLSEFFAGNLLSFSLLFVLILFISLTPFISISLCSIALFFLFGALGLLFHFTYILTLGLLTVWLKNVNGMLYFLQTITGLLAGTVIPLNMLPEKMQWLVWNPFSLSVFFPSQIIFTGSASLSAFLILGLWCFVAYIVYRAVLSRALKKYQAFGG